MTRSAYIFTLSMWFDISLPFEKSVVKVPKKVMLFSHLIMYEQKHHIFEIFYLFSLTSLNIDLLWEDIRRSTNPIFAPDKLMPEIFEYAKFKENLFDRF